MTAGLATADKVTARFTVDPQMECSSCENKIKSNLRFEKGVKSVKPSAKEQIVVIEFDDSKTNIDALKAAFAKIGYEAEEVPAQPAEGIECPTESESGCTHSCCK